MSGFFDSYKVDVPCGKRGAWEVSRFEIPQDSYHRMRLAFDGRDPGGGTFTKLTRNGDIVMSDTRAEIIDLADVIWKLRERETEVRSVLINGLGLGVVLKVALEQPHISHIDVVEIDADVIELVGAYYLDLDVSGSHIPSNADQTSHHPGATWAKSRLTIHHGNALTYEWPKGKRWDVVWHDIWDTICSDNLPDMRKLHRRYGRRCGWQGSWCRERCERGR